MFKNVFENLEKQSLKELKANAYLQKCWQDKSKDLKGEEQKK